LSGLVDQTLEPVKQRQCCCSNYLEQSSFSFAFAIHQSSCVENPRHLFNQSYTSLFERFVL